MRKLKDFLRLRLQAHLSIRQIAASSGLSVGAVQKVVSQATSVGLDWGGVHQELKRKGLTKQLLLQEYRERFPERAYSHLHFCARYMDWLKRLNRSMRQHHKAGEKCFIDYCGPTVPSMGPVTGHWVKQRLAEKSHSRFQTRCPGNSTTVRFFSLRPCAYAMRNTHEDKSSSVWGLTMTGHMRINA